MVSNWGALYSTIWLNIVQQHPQKVNRSVE
jgi:hypothetical protein